MITDITSRVETVIKAISEATKSSQRETIISKITSGFYQAYMNINDSDRKLLSEELKPQLDPTLLQISLDPQNYKNLKSADLEGFPLDVLDNCHHNTTGIMHFLDSPLRAGKWLINLFKNITGNLYIKNKEYSQPFRTISWVLLSINTIILFFIGVALGIAQIPFHLVSINVNTVLKISLFLLVGGGDHYLAMNQEVYGFRALKLVAQSLWHSIKAPLPESKILSFFSVLARPLRIIATPVFLILNAGVESFRAIYGLTIFSIHTVIGCLFSLPYLFINLPLYCYDLFNPSQDEHVETLSEDSSQVYEVSDSYRVAHQGLAGTNIIHLPQDSNLPNLNNNDQYSSPLIPVNTVKSPDNKPMGEQYITSFKN